MGLTMKSSKFIFIVLFVIYFLSGCSTNIKNIQENYKEVIVGLDTQESRRYYLFSDRGRQLSTAVAYNGRVVFPIPYGVSSKDCIVVADNDRRLVSIADKRSPYFQISVPEQHTVVVAKQSTEKNRLTQYERDYSSFNQSVKNANYQLSNNRSFQQSGNCIVPRQMPIPAAPETKCKSKESCNADASQICFAMAFGAEGCSIALAREGIPGVVSGPTCGAVAAQLGKEKYEMGDAVKDAIHGLVDDYADKLTKENDFFSWIIGHGIKLGSYAVKLDGVNRCRNSFVEKHYGPYERWLIRANEIKNEPRQSYESCQELIKNRNRYSELQQTAEYNINNTQKTVENLGLEVSAVKRKEQSPSYGCNR